MYCRPYTVNR